MILVTIYQLKNFHTIIQGNGTWIILSISMILAIVVVGLTSQIKKSECENRNEIIIEDEDDYCKKIQSKNKGLYAFSIVVIVLIIAFCIFMIYEKNKDKFKSMKNNSVTSDKPKTNIEKMFPPQKIERPHTAFGSRRRKFR